MCPAVSYSLEILMLISTYKTPVSKPGLDPAGLVVGFFSMIGVNQCGA